MPSRRCGSPRPSSAPTTPRLWPRPATSRMSWFSWVSRARPGRMPSRRCGSPRPSSAPTTPRPWPRPPSSARSCGCWASRPRPGRMPSRRCGSPNWLLGRTDQRVAAYLHRLADARRAVKPDTEAISLLERATTIDEASHGPAHASVVSDLRCLAAALTEAGRRSDAIDPLERILAAEAVESGEVSETLLPTLTSLTGMFFSNSAMERGLCPTWSGLSQSRNMPGGLTICG